MIVDLFQRLIRWMPLALLVMLFMVDRDNIFHKVGYIVLLLSYTSILIIRVLYAKENWHREFNANNLGRDSKIEKMSDYQDRLSKIDDSGQESSK